MATKEAVYDITIIGGGPAGMFAGFYAGLRDAKTQIIESLSELGGQVSALYPEKTILDVGGYPNIKAKNLVTELEKQLRGTDTAIKLNQTVTDIDKVAEGYQVTTNKGTTLTKAIIIATGVGAFNPRKLAVDNGDQFEGKQLFYSVKDLEHFRDRDVLVAGGGDAAIDEALLLNSVAKKVYLLHRRDKFRAMEHSVTQLIQSSIELVTPYLIQGLTQQADGKVKVSAKKMKTEDIKNLVVDDIVVNYGFIAQDDALNGWTVHPETDRGTIKVASNALTSIDNVFAIGDVSKYEGKQPLIATAFGEAPIAVNAVMKSIYPERRGPVHSTSLKK
ncbi:NAD(P)/FAD-dependent oxidoreductase [Lentilactobacillus kisonensis]|uniref:Ferredoxin--NADP reductase n=1 Tax=Lentilactobacillus kisonensis DSM 19906 = JCM 15041 TaxID=1423766 RepID=A0A0R1NQ45_9LACO|nr:NAD(P)/FAD-dependent oxidoreductase [Lentilactobacillus kisonensis]KRL22510.1 pyridine nucleotide-disulfide oxidoreductase [Lentilactobacillus kisonensis DSM 19906 = JCM 15041]